MIMIDYKVATLVFKSTQDMEPKYLMELIAEKKISRLGLWSANKTKLLTCQLEQEKHFFQELSVSMDQLYGTTYWTISGPQQTAKPSKDILMLCSPNFIDNRIIGISVQALYISSTHSHLYQRW